MNQDFLPLAEFVQDLLLGKHFPYEVKVSFEPLIKRMESFSEKSVMSDAVCQEVVQKLQLIENLPVGSNQREAYSVDLERLLAYYFPLFSQKDILGFVGGPFGQGFVYQTSAVKQLFQSDEYEIRVNGYDDITLAFFPILHPARLILDHCYHRQIDLDVSETFTLRHRRTGLEKHYRSTVFMDSINITEKNPLKPLTDETLQDLLNHYDDRDRWLAQFPPEDFAFEGLSFVLFEDVTEMEILSRIRERIGNSEDVTDLHSQVQFVEQQLQSFLNNERIVAGITPTIMREWNEKVSKLSILSRADSGLSIEHHPTLIEGSLYERVTQTRETIICRDLNDEPLTKTEQVLLANDISSLALIPVIDNQNEVIALIELGAPKETPLSAFTLFRLSEVLSLLKIGLNRFRREVENQISVFMQKEFTSIHPSVDWKFRQVAKTVLYHQQEHVDMDISFPDVYPLFGQLDIVGSSRARNQAIQADLSKNLSLLADTLQQCRQQIDFPLLGMIAHKVKNWKKKITDNFFSSDETQVSSFFLQEVHPLLRQMAEEHPSRVGAIIQGYFNGIDPEVGIVYEKRKDFEQTVSQINQSIAEFIEAEEISLQQILPHYFELYKTDGIEYNLYLGQSLLTEHKFSEHYLRNFRLWQLISMCNIVRQLEKTKEQLPLPLSTAQLIFVYGNTLNIQFRKDEKKFDVEGVYNVRYEIIKKRIDKAYVADKNERLTLAGHIAITYLDDKDKNEYHQYLTYLVQENYIEPKIEELTLEKVQGVEGIKALRVKVKIDGSTLKSTASIGAALSESVSKKRLSDSEKQSYVESLVV
ncbi:MAG: hypothetical protein AAF632_09955 [Bacteroidota bacterium]